MIRLSAIEIFDLFPLTERRGGHRKDNPRLTPVSIIDRLGRSTIRYKRISDDRTQLLDEEDRIFKTEPGDIVEVKKIITHVEPRHFDDYFALAFLVDRYPDAKIELRHPQDIKAEDMSDPSTIIFDVGGAHDPDLLLFDHHQDVNVQCSLCLVLKHFGYSIEDVPAIQAIDINDRFGPRRAIEMGLLENDPELYKKSKLIISTEITKNTASIITSTLIDAITNKWTHREFIETLYDRLLKTDEFQKSLKLMEEAEKAFKQALDNSITFELEEYPGMKISISDLVVREINRFFEHTQSSVLIVPSNFAPDKHTNFYANTAKDANVNIEIRDKIFSAMEVPEVFRHKTNFLVVGDVPISLVKEKLKKLGLIS